MTEKRVELRTFEVHLICDKCGEGEMLPTGIVALSLPPQYPHECNKCSYRLNIRGKHYPCIEYKKVLP